MDFTPKIQKAINLAAMKHQGQNRRGIRRPYIIHPFAVAVILSEFTDDEDIIAAGLLHDVLEDAENYSFADMKADFGRRIAMVVREVSEEKEPGLTDNPKATWERRKTAYLNKLKTAGQGAMMVSAADKIHNLLSMIEAYEEEGEKLWKKFHAPLEKKLWYYGEVLNILKYRLDNRIVKRLEKTYRQADKLFGRNRDIIAKLLDMKKIKFKEIKTILKGMK